MDITLLTVSLIVFAYLLGSVSTAIITCKLMGLQDPRESGSNNPGATNVLRMGGKKAAIITLIGDMLKGFIPVFITTWLTPDLSIQALVGLLAFLGHIFPLYYGFKGGKGVATYYGVILAIDWQVGLIALTIWLSIAVLIKISSLSALISILCTPFILWFFTGSTELTATVALMSLIAFWRHRGNIQRLISGEEKKLKKHPSDADSGKPD